MSSQDELAQKLAKYKEQLVQLTALRANDMANKELAELQSNLNEAIILTEELLRAAVAPSETAVADNGEGGGGSGPAQITVSAGTYVSAFLSEEGKNCNAYIVKVNPDGSCQIRFIGNNVEIKAEPLSLRAPIEPDQEKLGTSNRCSAVFSEDGKWYEAIIDDVTPNLEYAVTFVGYGNKEIVNRYHIRPWVDPATLKKRAAEAAAAGGGKSKKKNGPEILPIPDHLKIHPSDSEAVRAKKKKQIHAIKQKNRLATAEHERNSKQQTWQSFMTKAKPGKKDGSIFQTPDNPAAKVGVTGSGKEITHYDKARRFVAAQVGEVDDDSD